MASQIALLLTEIGKPLTEGPLPIPEPNETELLIKVTAAGLAPVDAKLRDKNAFNIATRLPAVLSGDIVGTVIKNGIHRSFPVGSHVFSQALYNNPKGGALQEYTLINPLFTAMVPSGISDTEAALYPINAMTSALGLFSVQGLGLPFPGTPESKSFDYASTVISIIGGGSNTGKLAIQLAKIAGIGKIITIASLSSADELKSLGATHVIARQASDIEKQVRAIVGDEMLYVYDTMNNDLSLAVSLLSNLKTGTIAHLVGPGASDTLKAQKKFEARRIAGFSHAIPEFGQMMWKQLPIWLESGEIKPAYYKVIEGLDADQVNTALDEYTAGKGNARYHVRVPASGKL